MRVQSSTMRVRLLTGHFHKSRLPEQQRQVVQEIGPLSLFDDVELLQDRAQRFERSGRLDQAFVGKEVLSGAVYVLVVL